MELTWVIILCGFSFAAGFLVAIEQAMYSARQCYRARFEEMVKTAEGLRYKLDEMVKQLAENKKYFLARITELQNFVKSRTRV